MEDKMDGNFVPAGGIAIIVIGIAVTLFAAAFTIIALGKLLKGLKDDVPVGHTAWTIVGVVLLAALTLGAAYDLLGERVIIGMVWYWFTQIFVAS
jgi:hypothetical protein